MAMSTRWIGVHGGALRLWFVPLLSFAFVSLKKAPICVDGGGERFFVVGVVFFLAAGELARARAGDAAARAAAAVDACSRGETRGIADGAICRRRQR